MIGFTYSKRYPRWLCPRNGKPLMHKIDENGCWIVISHNANKTMRYVSIKKNGKVQYAHRYIYEKCFGKIPKGMEVMHSCDNIYCINPCHLKLGTHEENIQDASRKGRMLHGEQHCKAKLTEEQVRKILINNTTTHKNIAIQYGVNTSQITRIKNHKYWKHLHYKKEKI